MIRYALTCDKSHRFDSWFASADAYDRLRAAGQMTCVQCGSGFVDKAVMAPSVRTDPAPAEDRPLSTPTNPVEQALADMRRQVEENSEYVGLQFAAEARAIHDGDSPERAIYGEARLDDAKALLDEGIHIAPLPFSPRRRAN